MVSVQPFGLKKTLKWSDGHSLCVLNVSVQRDSAHAVMVYRNSMRWVRSPPVQVVTRLDLPFDVITATCISPKTKCSLHNQDDDSPMIVLLSTELNMYSYSLVDDRFVPHQQNKISLAHTASFPHGNPTIYAHPHHRLLCFDLHPSSLSFVSWNIPGNCWNAVVDHVALPSLVNRPVSLAWLSSASGFIISMIYVIKGISWGRVMSVDLEMRILRDVDWFSRALQLPDHSLSVSRHPNTPFGFVASSKCKLTAIDAREAVSELERCPKVSVLSHVKRLELSIPLGKDVNQCVPNPEASNQWSAFCVTSDNEIIQLSTDLDHTHLSVVDTGATWTGQRSLSVGEDFFCGGVGEDGTTVVMVCGAGETFTTIPLEKVEELSGTVTDIIKSGHKMVVASVAGSLGGGWLDILAPPCHKVDVESRVRETHLRNVCASLSATCGGNVEVLRVFTITSDRYICFVGRRRPCHRYAFGGALLCELRGSSLQSVPHIIPFLPGEIPIDVQTDGPGRLWVLYAGGELMGYNLELSSTVYQMTDVTAISASCDGLWILDKSTLYQLSKDGTRRNAWEVIANNQYPLVNGFMYLVDERTVIVADTSGRLFLCSEQGSIQTCCPRPGDFFSKICRVDVHCILVMTHKRGLIYQLEVLADRELKLSYLDVVGPNVHSAGGAIWGDEGCHRARYPLSKATAWIDDPPLLMVPTVGGYKLLTRDLDWGLLNDSSSIDKSMVVSSTVPLEGIPEKLCPIRLGTHECLLVLESSDNLSDNKLKCYLVKDDTLEFLSAMTLPPGDHPVDMDVFPVMDHDSYEPVILIATQSESCGRILAVQLIHSELRTLLSSLSPYYRGPEKRDSLAVDIQRPPSFNLLTSWMERVQIETLRGLPWNPDIKDRELRVRNNYIIAGGENQVFLFRLEIEKKNGAVDLAFILLQKFLCHLSVSSVDSLSRDGIFIGDTMKSVGAFKFHESGDMVESSNRIVESLIQCEDINIEQLHSRAGAAFLSGDSQLEEVARDGLPFQTLTLCALSDSVVLASDLHGNLILQLLPRPTKTQHQLILPESSFADIFGNLISTGGVHVSSPVTALARYSLPDSTCFHPTSVLFGDEIGNIGTIRFFTATDAKELRILCAISRSMDELDSDEIPPPSPVTCRPCPKYTFIDGDRIEKVIRMDEKVQSVLREKALLLMKGEEPDELGSLRSMVHYIAKILDVSWY
eukprot:GHVH01011091.1.p1 GENE.GHVH01011091.1~~GHVH01011091.1.p1  ORF type:complete len:1205 (+),score=177.45 GHVH01011091.1:47-3661(+)